MSGLGDFINPVGDFLGFGETDAQQASKDFAQRQQRLQQEQFKTLEEATAFSAPQDPFTSGPLTLTGRDFTGAQPFAERDRAALVPFVQGTQANIDTLGQIGADTSSLDALNARSNTLRGGIRSSLDEFGNLTRGTLSDLGGIREDLASNQNPFIQARVDPLINALSQRRQELKSGLDRRQVAGSFANQDLTNLDIESQRAIGNQRALATNESLQAQLGALSQIQQTGGQLTAAQLQGFQQSSGLDQTQFDAASQQFNRQLSAINATAQGQKDILNARNSITNGEFARAMQGLGLSINTQNALLSLASNLFVGSGNAAANIGGVEASGRGQVATLEQSQQTTGLGAISGLVGFAQDPLGLSSGGGI